MVRRFVPEVQVSLDFSGSQTRLVGSDQVLSTHVSPPSLTLLPAAGTAASSQVPFPIPIHSSIHTCAGPTSRRCGMCMRPTSHVQSPRVSRRFASLPTCSEGAFPSVPPLHAFSLTRSTRWLPPSRAPACRGRDDARMDVEASSYSSVFLSCSFRWGGERRTNVQWKGNKTHVEPLGRPNGWLDRTERNG